MCPLSSEKPEYPSYHGFHKWYHIHLPKVEERKMTHVVTSACVGCKDTSCVAVCPVDAFHEGPEMLYINPHDCIDCGACIPECPVEAIYIDDEVPEEFAADIELNAKMVEVYPVITESRR